MAGYILQGGDGKEYGPVDEAAIRSWIEDHRVIGSSLIKPEGGEFAEAKNLSQFASYFTSGDYHEVTHVPGVDTAKALKESWHIFLKDPLRYYGLILVFWGACIVLALLPEVLGLALAPLVGSSSLRELGTGLLSLAMNLLFTGPLLVGCYRFLLRGVDGGKPGLEQLVFGFRSDVVGKAIGVQVVKFIVMSCVVVAGIIAAALVALALGLSTNIKPELIAKNPFEHAEWIVLFVGAVLVVAFLVMLVVTLMIFVEFLLADESQESFVGLFTKSSQLALSKVAPLAWYFTVLSLIWLLSFVCLVIPALLLAPWLMLSMAHVYRQIAGPSSSPTQTNNTP